MSRWLAIFATCLLALPAYAGDYDRNVVNERTVDLGFGLSPMDVDTRARVACTDQPQKTCEFNVQRANVIAVRGAARRHLRNFYLGATAEAGATLPIGDFPARPWLGLGGALGLETANTGWDTLRGFAELGIMGAWADTRLAETLAFTLEGGVRYQIQSADRPHMMLHASVRGMYNFSYLGVMGFAGVGWTFD